MIIFYSDSHRTDRNAENDPGTWSRQATGIVGMTSGECACAHADRPALPATATDIPRQNSPPRSRSPRQCDPRALHTVPSGMLRW
jgi:hypothetical protein